MPEFKPIRKLKNYARLIFKNFCKQWEFQAYYPSIWQRAAASHNSQCPFITRLPSIMIFGLVDAGGRK